MATSSPPSYEIQGRTVGFPVEVRDAKAGIASFVVPSAQAQRFVGEAFEVAEFLPHRTLLFLACIDYRDNDLGDYNEVAINFFVRKLGAAKGIPYLSAWRGVANGTLSAFTYKMPVNQSFTRDAGATIWGFPKTVEKIDFDYSVVDRFSGRLEMDGKLVFRIDLPRGGERSRPAGESTAYTYINDIPHLTRFSQATHGVGVKLGGSGVELELGPHPIADDLRSLGLPKKPLMTTWAEKMVMSFGPPEKL
jgi:hypothetical protein